ncbi:nucleolar protein 58-like [Oscarella lobularis]|uniref:nucleolar protein 58-like n=1 Tax=Oscarella lobularis TaxID=121494 RepID=UPI00331443BF
MLVLFESPAGYAIFKLLDEKKLQQVDNLYRDFETPDGASQVVKLKHFEKFDDMTEALSAATASIEGKMTKNLKKLLKKVAHDELAVADAKLGSSIKDKLSISCVTSSAVQELMRGIRSQFTSLLSGQAGVGQTEINTMTLGLAHSLSRYKLKFSPDKVDTMIVQAITLLDSLDKELNNYIMRCREWYGWHFPELGKILSDHVVYAKTVKAMGDKTKSQETDFSGILSEELEEEVKSAAEISMGTEVSEEDIGNITYLCDQILEITDYRTQLYDYLKNRMSAIAPNLTVLVGELVGARLISHAGSLINLAKHPASTVQILGAEKALFRALKTKHATPKYGLIYHASLVGQAPPKMKGKISRVLAAKASLAIRYDALGEGDIDAELGMGQRAVVEERIRQCEDKTLRRISGTGKMVARQEKYELKGDVKQYNPVTDSTLESSAKKKGTKRRREETEPSVEVTEESEASAKKTKKEKKKKKKREEEEVEESTSEEKTPKKKKKKRKTEEEDDVTVTPSSEKKKKKKKKEKET